VLDAFYFIAFGGAILAAPMLGIAWLIIYFGKIPAGTLKRRIYQGAIIAALLLAFVAYELLKPR
jgi:hypothetical protein